ncbi:MAG: 7-cyano-7-deazaguanine synthase [Saprospiraceae bacterium]|nr:7-cyano-7-deazaguanine synthase [Saprospiraceae bacterium]MBK7738440.1 7-cyano-7-deazaguanine synthase [Saprospiraceae bacterium]MBK7912989.1 7-cyano-7-deazaguanine synthase [Saprospiraceae bacterium]
MADEKTHIVLCGGSPLPKNYKGVAASHLHRFSYDHNSKERNINIGLPHFIKTVNCHFPDRIKDLVEIAGYIYAADRMIKRGNPEQVEYHSWARKFHFHIKVRDYNFWKQKQISERLNDALCFIAGDLDYKFTFIKGGQDVGQKNLFDNEKIKLEKKDNSVIALFSGGLDSLAGALEKLETTNQNLILVSHRSNNFTVSQIQENVFNLLNNDYPNRIQYFTFYCNLSGERAVEETQRTRIFLYSSIAYALMSLSSQKQILVFENGMTSINFYKRQDAMNARASRTTHPQTIALLENILSFISGETIELVHPFLYNTKTDIVEKIKMYKKQHYLNSTISCTRTFQSFSNNSQATHCGGCSQCIDRRIAAYASHQEDFDAIYDADISKDSIEDKEAWTHLCDYINLAYRFSKMNGMSFNYELFDVLQDIIPFLKGNERNTDKMKKIFELTQKHTDQVFHALQRIRLNENIRKPKKGNTIFNFIDSRVYLKPSVERLIERISEKLMIALPIACERQKPNSENALNDLIKALIMAESDDYSREFPVIKFSYTKTVPDHSYLDCNLFIETKYLRGDTTKNVVTKSIAEDLVKYGDKHKLFVLYDPERKITDEQEFKNDFEKYPNCKILRIG